MFETTRKAAPEPDLADSEATLSPLNASLWTGAGAVVAGAAQGTITARNQELSGGRDPRV